MGKTARPHEAIVEEEAAVVAAIARTLQAKSWPCVVPRLPKRGRTEVAACWRGELGQSVLDAVVAAMDNTRRQQLSQPGAKSYHCQPASEDGALELIDSLAGGSSRLRNFDRQPYFHSLAQRHGVDDIPMVRILRSHGLPDDGPPPVSPHPAEPPPEPVPEPAACMLPRSRSGANAFDEGLEREAKAQLIATALNEASAADPTLVEAVRRLLSSDAIAVLAPPPPPPPLALPPLAPPPLAPPPLARPPPPPHATSAAEEARNAIAQIDMRDIDAVDDLYSVCDAIGAKIFQGNARKGRALRRCLIAMQRLAGPAGLDGDGNQQCDFILPMLECYGADDEERLPFCSMLTWFVFYAFRPMDDHWWGSNMSSLHFDQDGGMYLDAWTDVMDFAGHIAINILRGHMFSGMIKSGQTTRGRFSMRDLMATLEQRGERLFFGTAVPSVAAINARVKPEDKVDSGGRSAPLERAMVTFHSHVESGVQKLIGRPLAPLSGNEMRAADANVPRFFRPDGAQEDRSSRPRLVLPKKPKEAWKPSDEGKWWTRDLAEATAELAAREAEANEAALAAAAAAAIEADAGMEVVTDAPAAAEADRPAAAAASEAPVTAASEAPVTAETEAPAAAATEACTMADAADTIEAHVATVTARRAQTEAAMNAPRLDTIASLTHENAEAAQYADDRREMAAPMGLISNEEWWRAMHERWRRMDAFERQPCNEELARRIAHVVEGKPEEAASSNSE